MVLFIEGQSISRHANILIICMGEVQCLHKRGKIKFSYSSRYASSEIEWLKSHPDNQKFS